MSVPEPTPPSAIESLDQLDDLLSEPTPQLIDAFANRITGDIIILGVGGKMGPTLARMAKRASQKAGDKRRIIGVSRFSTGELEAQLNAHDIETLRCDLLDPAQLAKLPTCPNVVYMAGMKFGSSNQQPLTWAMNCYLPAMVCQHFHPSRIAAFSTGNLYGLTLLVSGGSVESDPLNPIGEYAMSCLGRERIFEHFAKTLDIPVCIIRLNYACELRYGVLVDLALQVWRNQPIDLTMSAVNVIWQGDANAMSLHALELADPSAPPVNVAGPEQLSVRRVCEQFAEQMDRNVTFTGEAGTTALLNNGQWGHERFGDPRIPAARLMQWITQWIKADGASLDKPTHFEVRDGKF